MADKVLAEGFNGLMRPMPTLPRDWYVDTSHHDREIKEIWRKSWIYFGRADAIANARDYQVTTIAGQSVIVVRGSDGELRAFHNVCRHRGSVLCRSDAGTLDRALIKCPYHQWAYDLTGQLKATGHMRLVEGFERAENGLFPVALAVWGGSVFLNLDPDAPDFHTAHGADLTPLSAWPMADLVVAHRYQKEMNCDWKVFWENFNECLHCPDIHPELCELVPIYGRAIMVQQDDPDWQDHTGNPAPRLTGGLREAA